MSKQAWTLGNRHLAGARSALCATSAGIALVLFCGTPVWADDTEIFLGDVESSRPNVLLIFDTSGSMDRDVVDEREPYDPATDYPGTCATDSIYWRIGSGTPPSCTDAAQGAANFFRTDQLACGDATRAIAAVGFSGLGFAAQWDPQQRIWSAIDSNVKDQPVECVADAGVHGPDAGDSRVYPADEDQWTDTEADRFAFGREGTNVKFRFYDSNWLNWLQSAPANDPPMRITVAQAAARALVQTASGVNIGLMRYSSNGDGGDAQAEGGMVVFPVSPVETSRAALVAAIDQFEPSGNTPLSETLLEARQYFAGADLIYGLESESRPDEPFPSVPESRTGPNGGQYLSPANDQCQANFIVYLTDGLPTADAGGEDAIETLIGAQCDDDGAADGSGRCLDDLAGYLFDNDQRQATPGDQSVTTYMVGFGDEVQGSTLLTETAARGGGEFFEASDSVSLTQAFDNVLNDVADVGTTFVAPAVAVNAFNRTESSSDVYLSVFKPGENFHWAGNVKKYRFDDEGVLVGADGTTPVVGDDDVLSDNARSIWSDVTDGADVELGGAANEIPAPAQRDVYTFLGVDPDLTNPVNSVHVGNVALTDVLLGLGQPGQPLRTDLIEWARGADVSVPGNNPRNSMGDPLHSRATVVVYGGTEADPDAVVFATTNDGYLHAIAADDGEELWSFIPADQLSRLPALFADEESSVKHYGLDGELRSLRIDRDRDGVIEAGDGDKVYLYFGMGRGGSNYYALDVTNKNSPRHQWTLTPAELPGVGQTWSPPTFTRVNISGAGQNPDKIALVIGGGYDPTQDNDEIATLYNPDTVGNRIFMVDAVDGDLLWFGGGPGVREAERNLDLPLMNNSIPAGVRVIDLDNDGFGDRMYVGDTGGRVWRFDIIVDTDVNQAGLQVPSASGLVTGGRLATLGAADPEAESGNAVTRRFYNSPDVALIRRRGARVYFNVALGSGWRGHPLNEQTEDHFYSIRDYSPFTKFTQAQYNTLDPIVVDDLADITTDVTPSVPNDSPGWRLELLLNDLGEIAAPEGEKVLAESRTFEDQVFFPTFRPESRRGGSCAPLGSNRVYAVSVDNGSPVQDINRDGETTTTDRYTDLAMGGIAPAVTFFIRRERPDGGGGGPGGGGGGPNDPPTQFQPVRCMSGWVALDGLCNSGGTVTRTYWRSR